MKARVKETGKEFKVMGVLSNTADGYALNEVDLYCDESDNIVVGVSEDYWTRLEHQAAIAAMQGMLNNSYLAGEFRKDPNNGIEDMSKIITKAAAVYAHALVEKMKEIK